MKIEKVNDNQIRCVLNKNDLMARNIKASELAYGSSKADILFKEMTEQANKEFGFQIDDSPIMIEAIPLAGESISLIITKVEDPEELDTRFSRFSPGKDTETPVSVENHGKGYDANEIFSLINSINNSLLSAKKMSDNLSKVSPTADLSTVDADKNDSSKDNLSLIYKFDSIDEIIKLARIISTKYFGNNSLYRQDNDFYLIVEKSQHTLDEFNQICNIICEFGNPVRMDILFIHHVVEHGELILQSDALQELAQI